MPAIETFNVRHRWLLIMAAIGGIHHPGMDDWFNSKFITSLLHFYIKGTFLVSIMLPTLTMTHFLVQANNLYDGILDLMICAASLLTTARFFWYYTHKAEFLTVLQWWDDDDEAIEREELIQEEMKYVKKIITTATTSAMFALDLWAFSQYFNEDKIMKLPTPIPYRSQSPDYEIVLTLHLFACVTYNFGNFAIHFFNLLPLVWMLCELRRLKNSLRGILESSERTEINLELKVWVQRHQKLISFHRASSVIAFSHSMEMMAAFMASWLLAFNYVQETVPFYDKISQVFFFLPYCAMFGITCYYADEVCDESKRIFDEAYGKNWIDLPKKYRSSFVIIAQRSQRPFITKGFNMFITGNKTFTQIMQSSYSVLNFLLASFRKRALEKESFTQ